MITKQLVSWSPVENSDVCTIVTEHEAAENAVDHCLGDIDPLLVIRNEPLPACHPTEGVPDDLALEYYPETGLLVEAPDDLVDEV